MALTLSLTKEGVMGDCRYQFWKVTGDNSVQYFATGMDTVYTIAVIGSTEDGTDHAWTRDSNDGTEGTAPGTIYCDAAIGGNAKIWYISVWGK